MTSAGLPACSITRAIVWVLPDPVTPSRVCSFKPASSPETSCSMACGWSPVGWYSLFTRNPLRVVFSMHKPRDLSWVVKRRASRTYHPIILRTRAFSRPIRCRHPRLPARRGILYNTRPLCSRRSTFSSSSGFESEVLSVPNEGAEEVGLSPDHIFSAPLPTCSHSMKPVPTGQPPLCPLFVFLQVRAVEVLVGLP